MDRKMQRELKGVVSALRTHAAQSAQLAERISKLIDDPVVSTGLVETADSETMVYLMQRARKELPDYSSTVMSLLTHKLEHANIVTVGDFRQRMQEHGRPDLNRSAAPYWWRFSYGVGKSQVELLIKIVDHFAI